MNKYEEKLERRRERLLERAAKHRHISEASFKRVDRICSMIPLGQPILVGHHSERHARADQARIHNGMRKGIDEADYAKELERRAESVGTGGVSSEDPEAVVKLKEQIEKAEKVQERMKETNQLIRRNKHRSDFCIAQLMVYGYSETQARKLLEPDFCGRIGYPDYALTNNNANIRRMKARVEQVTRLQATPTTEIEGDGVRLEDAPQDNRVRLYFNGKPAEAIRTDLKRSGFRWSPMLGCWQAYRNYSSLEKAKTFVKGKEA